MNLRVQSIHFNADSKLINFIREKVHKLLHYDDHIIDGEVFLKLDKANDLQNKVVQIRLQVKGNDLISRYQCRTFEEATDLCVGTLTQQIKKRKDRQRS
jgi:putative sigma-54 modulation protein